MEREKSSPVIETKNLTKVFGDTVALDSVTTKVPCGKIIGLVGSNGAGKSTLLRHAMGLYLPTEGKCWTLGHDSSTLPESIFSRIGYVHQEADVFPRLSAGNTIKYIRAFYTHWNKNLESNLLDRFDIPLKTQVSALSPGKLQCLAILLAVCHEPELLILDEPASALDPINRGIFLEMLIDLIQDQSKTILISSHILSDLEKVVDHVICMNRGRIICNRPYDELCESYLRVRVKSLGGPLPDELPITEVTDMERDTHRASFICPKDAFEAGNIGMSALGVEVQTQPLRLDELFPVLIGKDEGGKKV